VSQNTAYLGLGSNINPVENIKAALHMLAGLTEVVAVSSIWETRPVGLSGQNNFLNGAAIIKTDLTASQLKQNILYPIEQKLGRIRHLDKNAPRTIDLDLVLFNRECFVLGQNIIPDPDIYQRAFLAISLAEIAPDYVHPTSGETLQAIAARFIVAPDEMRLRSDISVSLTTV
jgi:2-amino-4-hydroxy-6-hydroxymethyldihydropteridine diphosphokinase